MRVFNHKIKGVTLLEIMLVLAIASSLLVLVLNYTTQKAEELRRDKTVLQMQQILNAGMSYYLNHSKWPVNDQPCSDINDSHNPHYVPLSESGLQPDYIPSSLTNNAYGQPFFVTCNKQSGAFYVATETSNSTNAQIIAGRLPLALIFMTYYQFLQVIPPEFAQYCKGVIASVNLPGQNLNNARSLNFGATYFSGSCVPAPNCPPNMKPEILVLPARVVGLDPDTRGITCVKPSDWRTCTAKANAINSFTAYARGDASGGPVDPNLPLDCGNNNPLPQQCYKTHTNSQQVKIPVDGTKYWRVCLSVVTNQGLIAPSTGAHFGDLGKMLGEVIAITRCIPNKGDEQPGGSIDVYQSYP